MDLDAQQWVPDQQLDERVVVVCAPRKPFVTMTSVSEKIPTDIRTSTRPVPRWLGKIRLYICIDIVAPLLVLRLLAAVCYRVEKYRLG